MNQADLTNADTGPPMELRSGQSWPTSFRAARLAGTVLASAGVRNAKFVESDLPQACLNHAVLTGAAMKDTTMTGAGLRGADITAVDFRGSAALQIG
jgi:uncharacterized protein YjbI with pentapeptide repeats